MTGRLDLAACRDSNSLWIDGLTSPASSPVRTPVLTFSFRGSNFDHGPSFFWGRLGELVMSSVAVESHALMGSYSGLLMELLIRYLHESMLGLGVVSGDVISSLKLTPLYRKSSASHI